MSLKEIVEAWNKTSTIWLRRCVYERLPASYNLAATYAASAVWHGFYPGYYFTFGSSALFILASRKVGCRKKTTYTVVGVFICH